MQGGSHLVGRISLDHLIQDIKAVVLPWKTWLVLHLLKFTEVIEKSCYPAVLPHKLCKYLYDLSVRFNSYCDSWEVGIAETKLLLCKATDRSCNGKMLSTFGDHSGILILGG